ELGRGMELMAVPTVVPPHSDLREPLRNNKEIPLVAGACDNFRKVVVEANPKLDVFAGQHGFRQAHPKDRVVVLVAVVRLDKLNLLRQLTHSRDGEREDFDRAKMLRVPPGIGARAAGAAKADLGHERGLTLEGVQVK